MKSNAVDTARLNFIGRHSIASISFFAPVFKIVPFALSPSRFTTSDHQSSSWFILLLASSGAENSATGQLSWILSYLGSRGGGGYVKV
jgi:hypothetical protein